MPGGAGLAASPEAENPTMMTMMMTSTVQVSRIFCMLVPGSVALRGVISLVQAQDLGAGQEAAMAALNTLMALLAGLLFGNLLVSARRNL